MITVTLMVVNLFFVPNAFVLEYCQAILRERRGAAFVASPASGELSPFGYQVIEITGHSDMWGKYRDLLICKVSVTLHASPESPLSC